MTEYRIEVHDFKGRHLCTLYDSRVTSDGEAYDIEIEKELNGWKKLSFTVPKRMNDGTENYRTDYLLNEYPVYLYDSSEKDEYDVYILKEPDSVHETKKLSIDVSCNHVCEELKTKNLYKYFTDENGIDTCPNLVKKALAGSGWTMTSCDTFYEADGVTEKIRSYSCDTKKGAYNMLSEICDKFNARPVFHGIDRTVEIKANEDSDGWMELNFGKNLTKIKRKPDSSNLVTRLYVEGEYGDQGYVGIDDVNPTGLSFLLNFDYFKETGAFGDEEQAALDTYIEQYSEAVKLINRLTDEYLAANGELTALIGTCGYNCTPILGGKLNPDTRIVGGTYEAGEEEFVEGDTVAIVAADGSYSYEEWAEDMTLAGTGWCIKFIPTITGTLATREDIASATGNGVEDLLKSLNKYLKKQRYEQVETVDDIKAIYGEDDLSIVDDEDYDVSDIEEPWNNVTCRNYAGAIGDAEATIAENTALAHEEMLEAIRLMGVVSNDWNLVKEAQEKETQLDDAFANQMGFMLRDGYWSDDNYAKGQEESLYADALDILEKLSKPSVTYDLTVVDLSYLEEYKGEDFKLSQTVRIYDPDLYVNDYAYVTKLKFYPDKPSKNTVELKTDIKDIGKKSFTTVLERITSLAEDVKNNREIYKRAQLISSDGTVPSSALEGAIDVLITKLNAASSNWKTDDHGNIIFTTVDGTSAMMLCGSGFMLANEKKEDGSWNWRTFGTGEGFTADMIIAGVLDAERIAAKSITVEQLSSDVGTDLNLSSNTAIRALVQGQDDITGKVSQLEIRENEIESTVSNMSEELATNSEAYTNSRVTQTSDAINAVITQKLGTDQSISNWLRFSSDGLTLGLSTSPVTVTITNSRMAFNNNGTTVAYIDGDKLHINEAVLDRSLSLGNYTLIADSDGGIALV